MTVLQSTKTNSQGYYEDILKRYFENAVISHTESAATMTARCKFSLRFHLETLKL